MLRQWHDEALVGTLQHRWMRLRKNIMPEIAWSQLRRRFTPGFESILEQGIALDWFDPDNSLHMYVHHRNFTQILTCQCVSSNRAVFRWLFIPWLQTELDAYCDRVNHTAKRRDRKKVSQFYIKCIAPAGDIHLLT